MLIVLDTNVLLVAIPRKSSYRPILDALINGKFGIILSNDILSEYIEVLQRKANSIVDSYIADMLLSLENLKRVEIYFEWKFIVSDPDDNKYADAAIAGAADYLVTNDQHFQVLRDVDFPKINVISITEFLQLISTESIP